MPDHSAPDPATPHRPAPGHPAPDRATPDQPESEWRPDLAAMVVPLGRHLVAAELPVLAAHGLAMWAYVVLLRLDDGPVRTQAALAREIGADKTRIIRVLDDLAEQGLIRRRPDPADRRARLLSLTPEGRRLRDSVRSAIQANEERLLARLPAADRRGFLNALRALSALPAAEFGGPDAPAETQSGGGTSP